MGAISLTPLSTNREIETRGLTSACGHITNRRESGYILKVPHEPLSDATANELKGALCAHKKYLGKFIPPTKISNINGNWVIVQKKIEGQVLCDLSGKLDDKTITDLLQFIDGCIAMYRESGVLADYRGWDGGIACENSLSLVEQWQKRLKTLFQIKSFIRAKFATDRILRSTNIMIDERGIWLVDCADNMKDKEKKLGDNYVEKKYFQFIRPLIIVVFSKLMCFSIDPVDMMEDEKKRLEKMLENEQPEKDHLS